MFQVKLYNKISPKGLSQLDSTRYAVSERAEGEDAILVRSAKLGDLAFGPNLRAIARAGAGVNNIPVERCSEAGIVVFNTPGANANAVKELVLAGLLLSSRKIVPALQWVQTLKGQGDHVGELVEKGKGQFSGPEIMGKKLGVIGLGAIGILVANSALDLGMTVYGYDPFLSVDAAWGLSRGVLHAQSVLEIYEQCDYITIHVPLNDSTKGMLGKTAFSQMKDGVVILNFARDGLVKADDLLEALAAGGVRCYVTDFPTEEMLGNERVVAIPHLGASTPESEENCAAMAARALADFLESGTIRNSVNFPDIMMEQSCGTRVQVMHRNIPSMIAQATNVFSRHNLNIENMVNRSKKEVACTMLNICADVPDSVLDDLRSIEGVLRVNVYR